MTLAPDTDPSRIAVSDRVREACAWVAKRARSIELEEAEGG